MDAEIIQIIQEHGGEITGGEVFKQCKGYSRYYISNTGRVYSTYSYKFLKTNAIDGKLIDGKRNGYKFVRIVNDNGITECRYLHRLVAENFIENPQNFTDVHHRDKNKENPSATNLMWVSRKENLKDAVCVSLIVTHVESGRVYKFDSITAAAKELCLSYYKIYKRIGNRKELSGFVFNKAA